MNIFSCVLGEKNEEKFFSTEHNQIYKATSKFLVALAAARGVI